MHYALYLNTQEDGAVLLPLSEVPCIKRPTLFNFLFSFNIVPSVFLNLERVWC